MIRLTFRWIQSLGLEFWLPIPMVAMAFWLGSERLTTWVLSRAYTTENRLQTHSLSTFNPSEGIIFIEVKLDRIQNKTQVQVRKLDASSLNFELFTVELQEVEAAIAQELNLLPEDIYSLIRYQIIQ